MQEFRRKLSRRVDNVDQRLQEIESVDQAAQLTLMNQYRLLAGLRAPPLHFEDIHLSVRSQNGEDGILLYLFTILGTTDRRCIELCASDGRECNTANLILTHGWHGVLIDGSAEQVARGKDFYARQPSTWQRPPRFEQRWLDSESVQTLIKEVDYTGAFDLLSLDVDGNDYWLLKSLLPLIRPRVIVLECVGEWGPSASVTIPYDPKFVRDTQKQPGYQGASLPAFMKLLQPTHRLVGLERLGYNAFFVQRDLGEQIFPERTPEELYASVRWTPAWAEVVRRWNWVTV